MKEMTKKAGGMMQENKITRANEALMQESLDMEPSSQHTVLIAGGGLSGLTLANDLVMRGIPFRLIDPLPLPLRDSRPHGFCARTITALATLGQSDRRFVTSLLPQH